MEGHDNNRNPTLEALKSSEEAKRETRWNISLQETPGLPQGAPLREAVSALDSLLR